MHRLPDNAPTPSRPLRRRVLNWLGAGWLVLLALVLVPAPCLLRADVKNGANDKPSKKDKNDKKAKDFLPEALDRKAKFISGKPVDIEIEASVPTLKQVDFVIRQAPANGTITAVRPHPKESNKAIVTYLHAGGEAGLSDRFTFSCRVGDGPYSAPGTVTLTGQKFLPILYVQNVTAMGKVFLGGESSLRLTIKNIGPAPFDADLTWEAPWHGPPHMELKAGELTEVGVSFQPTAAGIFRLDRLLQPGENASRLVLYGECVRPLTISPSSIPLLLNADTGAREGSFLLANGLSGPQPVKFILPPRLTGPPTVDVPGAGQTKVVLSISDKDPGAFKDDVLVISADGTKETVHVEAEAKPATLQLTQPAGGVLDLGTVKQGGEATGQVVLKNNGGMPAVVEALKTGSLKVTPNGHAIRIEPGKEGTFEVTLVGDQVGHLQTEAHIQTSGSLLRVPVKMNVTPLPREPDTPVAFGSGTKKAPPPFAPAGEITPETMKSPLYHHMVAYFAASGLPIPKDSINPNLERVREIEIKDRSTNSITIAWTKPQVTPAGWIIELASWARIPTGELVKAWTPMKNWEPAKVGDRYEGARLTGLPASSMIEIRLMGVDRDGKVSEPSTFAMETGKPLHISSWTWLTLSSVLMAVALYGLYRIREGYWDPAWKPLRRVLRL